MFSSKIHIEARFPDKFQLFNIQMPLLGLGTIWIGRKWPMDNQNYIDPAQGEINTFLTEALLSGIRMIDTAAAYGYSEERLGVFFKQNPQLIDSVFISTKWGEDFDLHLNKSTYINTPEHLRFSIKRSLSHLPKIDLLYIHKADSELLSDATLKVAIQNEAKLYGIKYIGASVSDPNSLQESFEHGLLWPDFIQTSSTTFWQKPDLLKSIFESGKFVVVNSPIRTRPDGMTEVEAFNKIISCPYISMVLTGTRHHLSETIKAFNG